MLLPRTIFLQVIATVFAMAAMQAHAKPNPAPSLETQTKWMKQWAWTAQPWTGNDAPYQGIRRGIDKGLAIGQNPGVLQQNYKTAAQQQPLDPQAQFRWCYVSYVMATNVRYDEGEKLLGEPRNALMSAPSPHTYEYDRLRFLVVGYAGFFDGKKEVTAIGKRLLQRDPADYDVKFHLASSLGSSPVPADRQPALQYAKELVREKPKMVGHYALLGSVYYRQWLRSKSRADADNAIAACRQYLQYAPADYGFRQNAQNMIDRLQKG